ncbi:MAG: cation transporter [Lentisphaeria bacterium]|nr:cation transporter [Lentisphaeria bacterium]
MRMQSRKKIVRNVTLAGMFCNLFLAVGKFLAGIFFCSHALVADGVHSLSDLVSDLVVLIGVRFWSAPPDEEHPYGHERIETLATLSIGIMLALAGLAIGWDALLDIQVKDGQAPGRIAFIVAVISVLLKEALYRWTLKAGVRINSSALKANAWHHRSDALSSIPAAAAVAVASFFPSWGFIDRIGAVIVSTFILHAAWKILRDPLFELADSSAPQRNEEIRRIALSVPGAIGVHAVRTRNHGQGLFTDLHLLVSPDLTVREGHRISTEICTRLIRSHLKIHDVVVHIEPDGEADSDALERTAPVCKQKEKTS